MEHNQQNLDPIVKIQNELEESHKKIKNKIIDLVLETERENYHNDLEPFDRFKDKLNVQINESLDTYLARITNGYMAILKKISEDVDKENTKHLMIIKI